MRAVQAAGEAAAAAMLELDAELSGLSDDVLAHEDAAGAEGGQHRRSAPDPLLRDWRDLSARTDAVIGHYLSALADQVPSATDGGRAGAARMELERAAAALREMVPMVRRFRAQYEQPLTAARGARTLAPRRVAEAAGAVTRAREATVATGAEATDPALAGALEEAERRAEAARRALAEGRAMTAGALAEGARAAADAVLARARELPARAAEVRRGAASVRTRREALRTRYERLAPVMSELRRRYRHPAWADVEQAPQRSAAAVAEVDATLAHLDALLAAPVLDVPAAAGRLEQVRSAAARAEREIRSARDRLAGLDAASADPDTLLAPVHRQLVDARRFLAALPEGHGRRYRATLDNLARRLLALEAEARGSRPEWGSVVREAQSIRDGLAAMVRTARSG